MHRSLLSTVLFLSMLLSTLVAAQDASYTFITFAFPGGDTTEAQGINNRGQIVGVFSDLGTSHGFLKAGDTFIPIDVPGAEHTYAWGINDHGEIVGWFDGGTILHGFLATPANK